MNFYTHIAQWGNQLLVRAVKNGVRTNFKVKYEPTLYVPCKGETGYKTLEGQNVNPMPFLSIKEAKEFVSQYESQPHLVYGMTQFNEANSASGISTDVRRVAPRDPRLFPLLTHV